MTKSSKLEPEILALAKEASDLTLAQWWCTLNSHRWPKALPQTSGDPYRIQRWIANRIGLKACLRQWNHKMTDQEFETWWANRPF